MDSNITTQSDWRVDAIKDWAERYSLEDWVERYTEDELLVFVYGVRSEMGAVRKFCRLTGVDNPDDIIEKTPREELPSKKRLLGIQDPEEFLCEVELRGIKLDVCSTCHIMKTPTGACDCPNDLPVIVYTDDTKKKSSVDAVMSY